MRKARAGRYTIKRGILLNTLLRASGGERPGLLEQVLRQSRELVGQGGLKGVLYSRDAISDPGLTAPNKPRAALSGKQRAEMVQQIHADARRILGHNLTRVVTANDISIFGFDPREDAAFDPGTSVIYVALQGSQDPRSTARHEMMHALRQSGVFTRPEWAALARMAQSRWIGQFDIRARYEKLYSERFDLPRDQIEELLVEEAVAEAFAEYWATRAGPGSDIAARMFDKVVRFLEAVANRPHGTARQRIRRCAGLPVAGPAEQRGAAGCHVRPRTHSDASQSGTRRV